MTRKDVTPEFSSPQAPSESSHKQDMSLTTVVEVDTTATPTAKEITRGNETKQQWDNEEHHHTTAATADPHSNDYEWKDEWEDEPQKPFAVYWHTKEPANWRDSNKKLKKRPTGTTFVTPQLSQEECDKTDWRKGNAPMPQWYINGVTNGIRRNWYGL